jgi:putative transposon-encoded protein
MDLLPREKLTSASLVAPYVVAYRHERRVDVEGYVSLANARYSVPPEHIGKRVLVVLENQQLRVRLGDVVIAEYKQAPPGSCITQEEPIEALRKQTLEKLGQPQPRAEFTDSNAVALPSLSVYEEVANEPPL